MADAVPEVEPAMVSAAVSVISVAAIRVRMRRGSMAGFPFCLAAGRSGLLMQESTSGRPQSRGRLASLAAETWRRQECLHLDAMPTPRRYAYTSTRCRHVADRTRAAAI